MYNDKIQYVRKKKINKKIYNTGKKDWILNFGRLPKNNANVNRKSGKKNNFGRRKKKYKKSAECKVYAIERCGTPPPPDHPKLLYLKVFEVMVNPLHK